MGWTDDVLLTAEKNISDVISDSDLVRDCTCSPVCTYTLYRRHTTVHTTHGNTSPGNNRLTVLTMVYVRVHVSGGYPSVACNMNVYTKCAVK